MNCLILTPEIKELASKISNESEQSVLNLVGLWQEKNNKSIEDIPLEEELNDFIKELRSGDATRQLEEALYSFSNSSENTLINVQQKVNLLFEPRTRRDRVSLITTLFSSEVSAALKETEKSLQERIENTEDEIEKEELQTRLDSLNRIAIIDANKPSGIFKRVFNIFNDYVQDTEENRIQQELNVINSKKGANKYSDEQKLEAAKKKAAYKYQEYRKIINDQSVFKALAEESGRALALTEGIVVDINASSTNNFDYESSIDEDEEEQDWELSTSIKEGWMGSFRTVSSHESLSQEVRKVLRNIPRLDYRGKYEKDDLGFPRFLNAEYVHATLIDKLKNMLDSEDMIPLMQELQNTKPWIKQIIKTIQENESLFSQFYQDFRKNYTPLWIHKSVKQPNGSITFQTIPINKPESIGYLLESWRDNYESGTLLDDDSIYKNNGEINKENAAKGLSIVDDLNNKFNNLSTAERVSLLENKDVWDSIMKTLHMIGVDANPVVLKEALTKINTSSELSITDPIMMLLPQLNIIFKKVSTEEVDLGDSRRTDLINNFSSVYNTIADIIAEVTEDAIESSSRENGKTYYSHSNPSPLGDLIKNLKNVMNNKERFQKFMQKEFKQYEWYFTEGYWLNDWLRQLEESAELRKGLDHKVVLNSDKVDYSNWDSLDYTLVLLTEYWGDPNSTKSNSSTKYAWYYVPILSDSPSAEFIRFRRYTTGDIRDDNGARRTYDDVILDKLTDLVTQEYNRIMLVRERDKLFRNNKDKLVENYDISRDEDGNIKNIGGAEFKFLPSLNNIKYANGKSFIDVIAELKAKGTGEDLKTFIRKTLNVMMDEEFEKAYAAWAKQGLLEKTSDGKYKYLPYEGLSKQNIALLNKAKNILGEYWNSDMQSLLDSFSGETNYRTEEANRVIDQIKETLFSMTEEGEITMESIQSILDNLSSKNPAKEALREYFWNSSLATSQIIQLTTTDLAFYKNLEDFQKRYKEVHAGTLKLNTKATYKGELIGREQEKTIYIKDSEIVSSTLSDVETIIMEKYKRGELTDYNAASILSKFGYSNHVLKDKNGKEVKYSKVGDVVVKTSYVNVADAQAYRSISSYRAILGMSGKWTDKMEQAYNNLKNNNWNAADFDIIWQTVKPFVYAQVETNSGIEGHTKIKTPIQHKNSEFLLLAMHELIAGPLHMSGKLKAINKFMEDNQIDVVQFESAVKVGKQGKIDLEGLDTEEEVLEKLYDATGIKSGNENPDVVHKIPYKAWGIQTATPEHIIDKRAESVGTQIRKLITADMPDNAIITVNGKSMSKKEWLDLYNSIVTENVLQSFMEVDSIFKDKKKIEEVLLQEIRGSQKYDMEMLKACTLDENGNFNLPLFDPVQSQRIQSLLNSIIKNRITKQKIRGGALIQVSDYGLTDKLHIVFEGEGPNKRIKYMECYMPAYSKDFYEPLMDPETHQLDVTKLPKDLRKLVGYRVPTEDKYSMAPLYIKGFLPQQNGSAIMLPAEITTLSGSDFDVDKMYVMLPEFKIKKFNMRQAREDYARMNIVFNQVMSQFTNSQLAEDILNEDTDDFKEWFNENKEQYRFARPIISKIKYDFNKSPKENGLKARNNLMIDMIYGVLTNSDTASKTLDGGSFDYQKKAARVVSILTNSTKTKLVNILKREGINDENIFNALINLPLDTLNKLAEETKIKMNPLSPTTQVMLHQQNMTGAKMISIYANHNVNHALIQHTLLALKEGIGTFMLNGKTLTSLHNVMNEDKEFISKNNAGFVAASVDNIKDPVLADLNQNAFTADATMLLSRLGYNPIEIGLLMNQPIILEMTGKYFREFKNKRGKNDIIEETLSEFTKVAEFTSNVTYDNFKNYPFYIDNLMNNLLVTDEEDSTYYQNQVAVGYLFQRIMASADALGMVVLATRADTSNGGAGPTIADTEISIQKVEDLAKEATKEKFPLINAKVVDSSIVSTDEDYLRKAFLNAPLPYLQAFYSLGVQKTESLLKDYFPQYSKSFREVISTFRDMTKTGKLPVNTVNNIYNDLFAYIMSKTDFFGAEPESEGNEDYTISANKRKDFINNFPARFKKIISENEDIANLEFIKRLKVITDANLSMSILTFSNVGKLSTTLKEGYMNDWASLSLSKNPVANKLALDLFRYNYYRNGFAFGPSTFIHLAPTVLRQMVPGYVSTLRSLVDSRDDYSKFIDQYVYNHLDNNQLVPIILDESSAVFINENGKIKNEVTIQIDSTSTTEVRNIIRKVTETPYGNSYDFHKYIKNESKEGFIYYKLMESDGTKAVYSRINPLGIKNNFIEYEYGKDVEEMESVVHNNENSENTNPETATNYEEAEDSTEDIYGTAFDSQEDTDYEEVAMQAAEEAFKDIYGTAFDSMYDERIDDISSIKPNEDYRDEDNKDICE